MAVKMDDEALKSTKAKNVHNSCEMVNKYSSSYYNPTCEFHSLRSSHYIANNLMQANNASKYNKQ